MLFFHHNARHHAVNNGNNCNISSNWFNQNLGYRKQGIDSTIKLPANIKSILPAKTIDFTNPWGLSPFKPPFCLKRSEFFMLSLCEIERICKNVNSAFVKSLPTEKSRELCF